MAVVGTGQSRFGGGEEKGAAAEAESDGEETIGEEEVISL